MKIIHCADIHLDSNMTSNMDKEKASERKNEILITFKNMCQYACDNGVTAIIIAGDLFDKKIISKTAINAVTSAISDNPQITFYYLRGNHDSDGFLDQPDKLPDNLKLFDNQWRTYVVNESTRANVTVTGVELSSENSSNIADSLVLKSDNYNIVTLHGQESEYDKKDKAETINIRALKNHCIDYLALGHIHAYKEQPLDARGTYCYSGCLEGRGFDECGEHGFVLLDIDEEKLTCTRQFISIAKRRIYAENVDVTGCTDTPDIVSRIQEMIDANMYPSSCIMKFTLVGELDAMVDKNIDYLSTYFNKEFYYLKFKDETKAYVDYNQYLLDVSLKGEYVRTIMADTTIDDADKADMVRMGLRLLAGEGI